MTSRELRILGLILIVGAVLFGIGISWGLPSRDADRFLFGDRPAWDGRKILGLAGTRPDNPSRGADVDATPLMRSAGPTVLNQTDQQRAQILMRYRLYSWQPDEMITFMSLAGMHPRLRDFDPKLYQYGGCWIYAIGVLLAVASRLHLVYLDRNLAYYLDHPEAFARFYLLARIYVATWGLVGIVAVYWLTRKLTRDPDPLLLSHGASQDKATSRNRPIASQSALPSAAIAAALSFLLLPVVINMAHEAKPHLPAAVLMLLTVITALRYIETGLARWWLASGLLCGLSFGTVLSALPVFVILPVMVLIRPARWTVRARTLIAAGLLGLLIYAITNPYVLINWFTNRAVLESNLHNSLSMYAVGGWAEGINRTGYLLAEAATPIIAVVGLLVGAAVLSLRWDRIRAGLLTTPRDSRVAAALLLAAPAGLVLLQFCSLAAGKPGEYGRFLVFPATALVIVAISCTKVLQPASARRWQVMFVLAAAVFGSRYVYAFYQDTTDQASRWQAARVLALRPKDTIVVTAEPAPYVLPPVDLFTHQISLDPSLSAPDPGQLLVLALDHPQAHLPDTARVLWKPPRSAPLNDTVISWADKPILIVAPR